MPNESTKAKSKPSTSSIDLSEGNKNLGLWDSVRTVPSDFKRPVSYGKRHFTTINQQYQLQQATALWGEMGGRWGMSDHKWSRFTCENIDRSDLENPVTFREMQVMLEATLYYPNESAPDGIGKIYQAADIVFKPNGDTTKSLITLVRSKALSCLGFGADVYMGWEDEPKYRDAQKTIENLDAEISRRLEMVKIAKSNKTLDTFVSETLQAVAAGLCTQEAAAKLQEAIDSRREEITRKKTK